MAYLDPAQGKLRAGAQGDAVANVAAANAGAAYTTAEQTLINELKTKVNALLAELRQAGVISS